jgi:Cell division protein CrgA
MRARWYRLPEDASPPGWVASRSLTSPPVATSTKGRGPGGASRKGKSATGRTSKVGRYKTPEESGRYTAPIPKNVRHSPSWFGALILVLLIGGVTVITVNYLAHLPFMAHGSPWGLVVGLAMIFVGFLAATRYR